MAAAADEPVANQPTDLLDELLSMGPTKPHVTARPRELTTRAAPPPPPPPIEVIAFRSSEEVARNGGRQVPLESGVLNVTALEAGTVEVISPPPVLISPAASATAEQDAAPKASVTPISDRMPPLAEAKQPSSSEEVIAAPPSAPPAAEVKIPRIAPVKAPRIEEAKAPPGAAPRAPVVAPVKPPLGERRRANGRPSSVPPSRVPDGSEPVSALPPVVTVPPRGMAKTFVDLPAVPARGPRDSLDDGWDASPAPPPPVVRAAVRVAEAVPLPPVRLPWEILAEDTLAAEGETAPLMTVPIDPSRLAPRAPSGEDGDRRASPAAGDDTDEWTNVPDESLADDGPDVAAGEALHDAVTAEPSQVSSVSEVLDSRAVAAAIPPAWAASVGSPTARLETPVGSSSVFPMVNSAAPNAPGNKSLLRRFAPLLGAAAVVLLAIGYFVSRGGSKGSSAARDTTVAAARPAAPSRGRDEPLELNPELAAALAVSEPPRPAPEPSVSASVDPKSTFNSKAANNSVARAISRARACKKGGAPLSAEAVVTFAPTTGRVVAVSVTGHNVGGTPLANCISSTLKTAKVTPFSGEAMSIRKTIKYK